MRSLVALRHTEVHTEIIFAFAHGRGYRFLRAMSHSIDHRELTRRGRTAAVVTHPLRFMSAGIFLRLYGTDSTKAKAQA
jgi:hypothetical protein